MQWQMQGQINFYWSKGIEKIIPQITLKFSLHICIYKTMKLNKPSKWCVSTFIMCYELMSEAGAFKITEAMCTVALAPNI